MDKRADTVPGHMREVTLRIRHHGEPESDVSARYPAVTVRSVSSMTGRGRERKRIVEISGNPDAIPKFLAEFDEADSILDVELLSPLGESRVFFTFTADANRWDSIAEKFSDMGYHYRMGTTIDEGWERWTLFVEADDLSEIIDSLEADDNDVRLVRNVELSDIGPPPQLEVTRFLEDLSPRQREVLATAVGLGYYDHGSNVAIETIAEDLGLATTTVWEHLSRAEEKVMSGLRHHLSM